MALKRLHCTPVRTQPLGDVRCLVYAVAGAMETAILEQQGAPDDALEINVDEMWKKAGAIPGSMKAIRKALEQGIEAKPQGGRWTAQVELISGEKKKRVDVMKGLLQERVPLVVSLGMFSDFHAFIGGGIYVPAGFRTGFHAVCVLGADDPDGNTTGAWYAKNSMGASWGDNGFFRMAWRDQVLDAEGLAFAVRRVATK